MNTEEARDQHIRRSNISGAVVYPDYRQNVVVWPGREGELEKFVYQTYGGRRHKVSHMKSSNSEDALTWTCFDTLRCLSSAPRAEALGRLWEVAFGGRPAPGGVTSGEILVGKKYGDKAEESEVDASIEGDHVLVFFEAKLYSPMSPADPDNRKPFDQIARKLRVGLKTAQQSGVTFYFILLDLAPMELLRELRPHASLKEARSKAHKGFAGKWQTAFWFNRYQRVPKSLREVLEDIPSANVSKVASNMGWLTWSEVYKIVLRAVIQEMGLRHELLPV